MREIFRHRIIEPIEGAETVLVRRMTMASVLSGLSQELAAAAEQAGPAVVTVHAGHRIPSSGIHWRKGVVVTANHTLRREDEIAVVVAEGKRVAGKLAGRDPGTDLAILRLDQDSGLDIPQFTDSTNLKLANFVLALGRTRAGSLVASAGIVGGLGGEWRSWRGGRIDQSIRLDLALYPGFSGGPLIDTEGKVLGLNTCGFGRGRAVTIPVSTVNRSVDELMEKGHIARPYLGIAMQPVALPEVMKGKAQSSTGTGLIVLHVDSGGPADKAGIVLGDVIVELRGKATLDTEQVQDLLASAKVSDKFEVKVLRGGTPIALSIALGERPAR
jgi:S1-C subfamily serine protease